MREPRVVCRLSSLTCGVNEETLQLAASQKAGKQMPRKGAKLYLDINVFGGWVLQEETEGIVPDRRDRAVDHLVEKEKG